MKLDWANFGTVNKNVNKQSYEQSSANDALNRLSLLADMTPF